MSVMGTIVQLGKQLFPTGRAFKIPVSSAFEKLNNAAARSEARAYADALSILNSAIPDNNSFTVDDDTDWERRLGLITNQAVALSDRKLAIKRKMAHPGTVRARQNWRYVESQLQAAGFNVYVYENRFPDGMGGYITRTPEDVTGGVGFDQAEFGDFQFNDFQFGGRFHNIVANYIDDTRDGAFNVGSNLRFTFYIGGNPLGTFVNIDKNRKDEFRQLVLRLKPQHTVAFLLINFV